MDNKQFGGITGKQYMNAGLTALTGVLANIANGKLTQSAGNIISNANKNSNMGATMPTHTAVRRASGGIVGSHGAYAAGGMVEGCYAGGGSLVGPSQPVPQDPQQGQQGPVNSQPDAQNPASQMITANAIKALLGQDPNPQQSISEFRQHFGDQALQTLTQKVKESQQGSQGQAPQGGGIQQGQQPQQMQPQAPQGQQGGIAPGMASGGQMQGSRDQDGMLDHGAAGGMDDSISSNNGQVRVANNEFIIPSDVVSSVGDGSSKAGAARITAGIANLRKAKYGRSKQPPKMNNGANMVLGQ